MWHKRYIIKDRRVFKFKGKRLRLEILICFLLISIVLIIITNETELLQTEILIKNINTNGINYDDFRELQLDGDILKQAEHDIRHLKKKYPDLQNLTYIDPVGYLTFSMMARSYNLLDNKLIGERTFYRGIGKVASTASFHELYEYYMEILTDLEYFPVPVHGQAGEDIAYSDSWQSLRNYGGNRTHEGTDIMALNNVRGIYPIISITDGIIENIGWLEKGGYRIGIRSQAGGYFYYAHFASYAAGLKQGDSVIAGQFLGFMGDSGYGIEGTVGQFDVHLHMGIYVKSNTGEMSVNPYQILKMLENDRTSYGDE